MNTDRKALLLAMQQRVHDLSIITCLLFLLLIGCTRRIDYFESAPLSPPVRLAHLSHPPGQCGPYCVKIRRAVLIKHPLDRAKRLKDIAPEPDLSLHEQLYLINSTLDLEMFGMAEVFKELATQPYLRHTARNYLLSYTNRLYIRDAESITKLLLKTPGVPNELTPLEKLWSGCFNIEEHAIFDLYRDGLQTDEILTTYYLSRAEPKEPEKIRAWRKRGDSWYVIILKRLTTLEPASIFVKLSPQKDIPKPFYRAYHSYWLGLSEKTPIDDVTINRLIQLKVVTTYFDLDPLETMKQIAKGKSFDEILQGQIKKPLHLRTNH